MLSIGREKRASYHEGKRGLSVATAVLGLGSGTWGSIGCGVSWVS